MESLLESEKPAGETDRCEGEGRDACLRDKLCEALWLESAYTEASSTDVAYGELAIDSAYGELTIDGVYPLDPV